MSVGIVTFMSLKSCSRQKVLALFILTMFIPCSASCNFDVRLVRFRTRAYDFI